LLSKIVESLGEKTEESTAVQGSDAWLGLTKGGLGLVEISRISQKNHLRIIKKVNQ
jgi:hypothetical protein